MYLLFFFVQLSTEICHWLCCDQNVVLLLTGCLVRSCCNRGWGVRGAHAPPPFWQISSSYINQGGHIIPTQYYMPYRIFRRCDGPEVQNQWWIFMCFLLRARATRSVKVRFRPRQEAWTLGCRKPKKFFGKYGWLNPLSVFRYRPNESGNLWRKNGLFKPIFLTKTHGFTLFYGLSHVYTCTK